MCATIAGHGIGMRQRVLAGVQRLVGDQRFGKGTRARQHVVDDGRPVSGGGRQGVIDDDGLGHEQGHGKDKKN